MMSGYVPPIADMAFVLDEWLGLSTPAGWTPGMPTVDAETARLVLGEAGRFASQVLSPINAVGDIEGCIYIDGSVRTPSGFGDAYASFVSAGWPSLARPVEQGGQGLPNVLDVAVYEMLVASNHAWAMYPGILAGACDCLEAHGSSFLKETFLPRLTSGEWLATMCLTEPAAGSDLGKILTTAVASEDGLFSLDGTKVFISGGDHDLTDNIVHLVLARTPGAPPGTKGLSLFLVPKLIPNAGGSAARNGVFCDGLERKMGIKASATCLMRFESAKGWLVGELHRGLPAMFVMMNAARLHVGVQGLAHAEAARQIAQAYASERMQGVPPDGGPGGSTISAHPSVRRTLLDIECRVQGMRAIAYWIAYLIDESSSASDEDVRSRSRALCELLTPVAKAYFTESGFMLSSKALQVLGGYGYTQDYGVEQIVRDSRVPMLYEGTNEIQAIDLLVKKVVADDGKRLDILVSILEEEVVRCRGTAQGEGLAGQLQAMVEELRSAGQVVRQRAAVDPKAAYRCADDFLRLTGLVLLGFSWARAFRKSRAVADAGIREGKALLATHFFHYGAGECRAKVAAVLAALGQGY